jgi:putative hemolysin
MTLAGLVLENLKRIPLSGEIIVLNGWRLEVIAVASNRIERVLVSRLIDTSRVLDGAAALGGGADG